MRKTLVVLYSRPDCHLCESALDLLLELQREIDIELKEIDITADRELFKQYFEKIPVIIINDHTILYAPIHSADLKRALSVEN